MSPLRRLRIDAGWTMVELAAAAGVTKGVVEYVEGGGGSHPGNLRKLAQALSERLDREIVASELLVPSPTSGAAA